MVGLLPTADPTLTTDTRARATISGRLSMYNLRIFPPYLQGARGELQKNKGTRPAATSGRFQQIKIMFFNRQIEEKDKSETEGQPEELPERERKKQVVDDKKFD